MIDVLLMNVDLSDAGTLPSVRRNGPGAEFPIELAFSVGDEVAPGLTPETVIRWWSMRQPFFQRQLNVGLSEDDARTLLRGLQEAVGGR